MHLSVSGVTSGPRQTVLCRSVRAPDPHGFMMFLGFLVASASLCLPPTSLPADVDECSLGGAVCPRRRKCFNTFGSFFCKCHLGFRLTYINGRYACIGEAERLRDAVTQLYKLVYVLC